MYCNFLHFQPCRGRHCQNNRTDGNVISEDAVSESKIGNSFHEDDEGEVDSRFGEDVQSENTTSFSNSEHESGGGSNSVHGVAEETVVIVVEDENHDPTTITLASMLYEEDVPWGPCTRSCRTRRVRLVSTSIHTHTVSNT